MRGRASPVARQNCEVERLAHARLTQVLANCDSRVARLRVTRAPGAVVRTVEPALLLWRGPASGRGSMQTAEKPWPGGPRKLEQRWPNVEEQRRG
jgi:hypothetical protein